MKMEIITLPLGMFQTNCYLAYDKESLTGVIIDPAADADAILSTIDEAGFTPDKILLTHGHGDHVGAVEELKQKFDIPVYAGWGEEELIEMTNQTFEKMFNIPVNCPAPDHLLKDGDQVACGSYNFTVKATPGHSPGGICFYTERFLFCGDTLFEGSIGRTDLPGGNTDQLISNIKEKLLTLPIETICFPGHGPATTIGKEKMTNPFLTGGAFV